jgi:hypothetical protein
MKPKCKLYAKPHHPEEEEEGAFALPQGEFGLDVIALVGALRHAQQASQRTRDPSKITRAGSRNLRAHGVTNLLERYEELVLRCASLTMSGCEGFFGSKGM